ncbi:MAG: hypothetical protein ABH836_00090 [Candidatus Omnitrophota bacterium]
MKEFLVGLIFLILVSIFAGIGFFLFPFLFLLVFFLRVIFIIAFLMLVVWLLGKLIVLIWEKLK